MTIEAVPFGMTCDASCAYCYYNPGRDAGNAKRKPYDLDAMKRGLAAEGQRFTLHGGDPLQMDLDDLTELWRWGFERYGANSVQTHGATITDEHIALGQRFNVHFGISVDGPGEMNDLRWFGTLEKTRRATERTHEAIRKLCAAGVSCSVIAVLHRKNIAPEVRRRFQAWMDELDAMGVSGVRFHPMEVDTPEVGAIYLPGIEEYVEFYRDMHAYMRGLTQLRIDVLEDIRQLLLGKDQHTTCTWNGCDVLTTNAVRAVDGQGNRRNCGRTNKDGVAFVKADTAGYERYIALYHTPQEHGGCGGCRFFFACKGQCPGEAIGGDWRNRSAMCGLYMALFETVEQEMLERGEMPLSGSSERDRVAAVMVGAWKRGQNLQIHQALTSLQQPGCHACGQQHGDAPHGDAPHGDHTDAGSVNHG